MHGTPTDTRSVPPISLSPAIWLAKTKRDGHRGRVLPSRVTAPVVVRVPTGAGCRRRTACEHVGGHSNRASRGTDRPANDRADGTCRPIASCRTGRSPDTAPDTDAIQRAVPIPQREIRMRGVADSKASQLH